MSLTDIAIVLAALCFAYFGIRFVNVYFANPIRVALREEHQRKVALENVVGSAINGAEATHVFYRGAKVDYNPEFVVHAINKLVEYNAASLLGEPQKVGDTFMQCIVLNNINTGRRKVCIIRHSYQDTGHVDMPWGQWIILTGDRMPNFMDKL